MMAFQTVFAPAWLFNSQNVNSSAEAYSTRSLSDYAKPADREGWLSGADLKKSS